MKWIKTDDALIQMEDIVAIQYYPEFTYMNLTSRNNMMYTLSFGTKEEAQNKYEEIGEILLK